MATLARSGRRTVQAKLVLLGDMGTGKTSLVLRFVKGRFFNCQDPTVGAAFFTQMLSLNEATVKLEIWDTAGQERYRSLAPMYYRNAAAALILYDISNKDSFVQAKKWVLELQGQDKPIPVMALVGNKVDLEANREVIFEEAVQFAEENRLFFIETSAKTANNINDLFYEIAKQLAQVLTPQPSVIDLQNEPRRRKRCCLV